MKNLKLKIKQKKKVVILVIGLTAVLLVSLAWASKREVAVQKGKLDLAKMKLPESGLAGERCENAKSRPVAVMMPSDAETRPLAGIAEADLVFEMPVTDGGVTRLMAVFQCRQPKEIGAVRSSRLDFIPLAEGLGAVYAHWGGEKEALAELNRGVLNNLDGLQYDGLDTVYYRKKGIKPPHNGFTSYDRLQTEIVKRGFNLASAGPGYLHEEGQSRGNQEPPSSYDKEFAVSWKYNAQTNSYERWRGGQLEIDANLNQAVGAKNVVILKTSWSPINKDYIRVKTVGSGEALIYKNGQEIKGSWEKQGETTKLFFYDQDHREIKFTPGPIWVEIVTS